MIELVHLRKEYESSMPLKDVNAVIRDGEVISVIGPSGTGKSTLLRCINMLEKPTSGKVLINGTDITAPGCDLRKIRQKMGMVFQSFNLFGHLTVIENVMAAPMDLLHKSRQEAYDEGMRLLRSVGLGEKGLKYPDELSGGQKQRVAIARTLAMDPDVILLDEPTSALDPAMVGEVQAVVRELTKMGKTMMIVTHEMDFAKAICSRVFYMDEGGIYEDGTPEQIFEHPQKEKTIRFIRRLKVLELEIGSASYDFLGTQTEIERWCSQNQISYRMTGRIHLAFEEMIQQILLPVCKVPRIRVQIEYSRADETAHFQITWAGDRFDPFRDGDALSAAVLKSAASDFEYRWDETAEYGNQAAFRILP